ncbi:MAG: PaaI family thioesterase [Clostridia bacterium]|nr:PaaI family thioesterase [Clostridia bacterium]
MKVVAKQRNSRMCAVCGLDNEAGLRAPFYTMEDGSVVTVFQYRAEHQSYPGRVHGGLIAAMIDEMGLRGIWAKEGSETTYGVTLSLEVKFRKPVPYDTKLLGRGIVTSETGHFFTVHAVITDGKSVLAEGDVKYMKLTPEQIAAGANTHEEMCYLIEDGVREIEI